MSEPVPEKSPKPKFLDIVKSALSAAIGVQSNKNRERDFAHGNIFAYVTAGIIFTIVFITSVILVVNMVIGSR